MNKTTAATLVAAVLVVVGFTYGAARVGAAKEQVGTDDHIRALSDFYPKMFVESTLTRYNVPQNQRNKIYTDLHNQEGNIVNLAKEEGAQMERNPFDFPPVGEEIVEIYYETQLTVFTDVLNENGIDNQGLINDMFKDLQSQKLKAFSDYMKKQNLGSQTPS